MNKEKGFWDWLKLARTYWMQVTAIIVIAGSIFANGVSKGMVKAAREKEKTEKAEDRKLMQTIVVKQTQIIDSLRAISYIMKYEVRRADMMVSSFKQSLIMNPQISKQDYLKLTQGIDNLIEELKKNGSAIVQGGG